MLKIGLPIEQKFKTVISISNKIIYGCTDWTMNEFNLFCVFLSLINKFDDKTTFEVTVQEIMELTGKRWRYEDFTKTSTAPTLPERVMIKPISITEDEEHYTTILPFNLIKYSAGVITFRLTEDARPILKELANNFTQANLKNVLNLSTYPTKILYLAIKSELYKSNFHMSFDIDDYKKLINISLKTEPRRLKKEYIQKPLQEIQEHLPLLIDYKMQKVGTSYKKIDFFPAQTVERVWSSILEILRNLLPAQDFRIWVEPITPISLEAKKLTIEVPSEFFKNKIESTYLLQFSSAIKSVIGDRAKLDYKIKKK